MPAAAIWCDAAERTMMARVWLRRERATLEDVVELLRGIGTILMEIDAKLEEILQHLEGDDDEQTEP